MSRHPWDKAALGLGGLAVLSPVFDLSQGSNTNFVAVSGLGLIAYVVIGLLAIAGGLTSRTLPVVVAGALSAVCGVLQFVQFGRGTNWLDGNGSTATLFLGLALGLLVVGLARPAEDSAKSADSATPLTQG